MLLPAEAAAGYAREVEFRDIVSPHTLEMVTRMRSPFLVAILWPVVLQADPAQEVRCAEIRFSLAVEKFDPASFRASIDEEARFVGEQVLRGPDAIAAAWSAFFEPDGPRIAWRPRFVEVLSSGELALTRGPYWLETRAGDGTVTVQWGTFNSVWRRGTDGHWRVVFDAGGPPTEVPTDASKALFESPADDCSNLPTGVATGAG